MSKNRRNRNNHSSAPQRARAEAMGATEGSRPKRVKYLGISIEVSALVFQDIEFIEAMLVVDDPHSSDLDKVRSVLNAAKMLAGAKWNELVAAIRANNGGHATIQDARGFIDRCAAAVAPEHPAS